MSITRIIGIDPGTNVMGFGVLEINGTSMKSLEIGCLVLPSKLEPAEKLKLIFTNCLALINNYNPIVIALEAPFYGKNVQSMLKLGRAQGMAIAAAVHCNIPFEEYSPKRVKQSITGSGNASKEQVAGMVKSILQIPELPHGLDATDGMAVALCHYFGNGTNKTPKSSSAKGKKSSNWKSFITQNPDRLK